MTRDRRRAHDSGISRRRARRRARCRARARARVRGRAALSRGGGGCRHGRRPPARVRASPDARASATLMREEARHIATAPPARGGVRHGPSRASVCAERPRPRLGQAIGDSPLVNEESFLARAGRGDASSRNVHRGSPHLREDRVEDHRRPRAVVVGDQRREFHARRALGEPVTGIPTRRRTSRWKSCPRRSRGRCRWRGTGWCMSSWTRRSRTGFTRSRSRPRPRRRRSGRRARPGPCDSHLESWPLNLSKRGPTISSPPRRSSPPPLFTPARRRSFRLGGRHDD